jgi:hypothetical protein
MHLEVVIPALFQARAEAPALQLALARGRRSEGRAATLEDWYAEAFGLGAGPLPAGALTAHAFGEQPACWLRADPVHLRADRDRLLLIPSAGFEITAAEARELCAELDRLFAAQFTLHAFAPDHWGLRANAAMSLATRPPLETAGHNVDKELPEKRFHSLLNEIQMALYQHPVNTARGARAGGEQRLVWGAGPLCRRGAEPRQSLSAEDRRRWASRSSLACVTRARSGRAAWLSAPENGRHPVVLDLLRGAVAFSARRALAQRLRSGGRWFGALLAAPSPGASACCVHVLMPGTETVRGDLRPSGGGTPLQDYAAARAHEHHCGGPRADRLPAGRGVHPLLARLYRHAASPRPPS